MKSPFGFPRGWRGVVIIFSGVCLGFVVGTLAGDGYSGRSTFELLPNQPRFFLYLFLFTFSVGVGISYFFYASGKSSYLQRELANLRALITTDPARAAVMLDHLIDYLRATLSASRVTRHSLGDEFARRGNNLVLDVTDNGVGLKDGAGIGLVQTRERLQAAYGDQATITLGAADALYTRASVTFPFENA